MRNMLSIKLNAVFWIFSICCWSQIAGNNLQQYGIDAGASTERINTALRCMNINPQNSVDLNQIMGLWYGSEVIVHTQDFPGVYEVDSCVIIYLSDVTDEVNGRSASSNRGYNNRDYNPSYPAYNPNQNNYRPTSTTPQYVDTDDYLRRDEHIHPQRYLHLVWSERDKNVEYTFNYTAGTPGQWSNIGDQRGSLILHNSYTQFSGTVQVVKAVNDHLVLTFCGSDVKSSIYTVVLSRNRLGLTADEIRSIRNLLSRRGLYTETIRKVCNSCSKLGAGGLITVFASLLLLLLRLYG
ncbi:uncharacterized protein Dwil_GK23676 [Drosophila willistoni]|uniref:Lipocalin/cytosolic fatty-acid binding domain-containing protein n=1 Tax=Drosophila willistoni TaxID=7260 RepID=B4N702_DROWI|nr:uncharacterized protein LOC6646451 [Drosophila willistoni]EDW80141.2 uncharacterized protein Dwil_GK23676 [Drosophila willistoni]